MKEQHGPLKEQIGFSNNGQQRQGGQRGQEKPFFGNYDLVRRIDVGGMGEVYLARQRTAFGREVAVKIIRSDLVHDGTARKRFLREAEVSAHLKHEHILPLVEFGEEQGRLFLVTPYIEGGTLARRLQAGPMSLSEVHQLFTALVRAVAYIHKRGVIHRDLKPGNILLDEEEGNGQVYVRLIDFGIASMQGMAASPPLTESGREMGTIEYMAPERLNGVAAPSNDIYSLGMILYEMLTGHLPSTTGKSVVLSPPMEYVFKHATAPDPENRFSSADQLLKVFEQAYRAVSTAKSASVAAQVTHDDDEAPRRVPTARPVGGVAQESRPSIDAGKPSKLAHQTAAFTSEDYSAPTTYIGPASLPNQQRVTVSPAVSTSAPTPSRPRRRRRGSLFAIVPLAIVALLLLMALLSYYAFQSAVSATVRISPQVHTVTKMLTVQAKPTLHAMDTGSASVPAYVFNSSKTASQQGNTTGLKCAAIIFDCKHAVAFSDVDTLASQLKQTLRVQVEQDLRKQAQASGATTVGNIYYNDGNPSADPAIGSVSDTVTVTLTEQGSVEYIKSSDVQSLARMLLTQQAQQQLGSNYVLLSSYTKIGQPSIQSIDANGVVTIHIAVGGVAEYNISQADIQAIQNHIKGLKQKDARMFLERQPGIDANSVVVSVSYGDTLPGNGNQIQVIPISPSNIPSVQLSGS